MAMTTLTPPAIEPVSEAEARERIRMTSDDTTAEIKVMIAAARAGVETYLRRRLITQTMRLTLNGFAARVVIPIAPVQSISAITYVDDAGTTQTLASSEYTLVSSGLPNFIVPAYLKTWPTTRAHYDTVTIDIVVGYGAASSDVPPDIIQAMYLLLGHIYEAREAVVIGSTVGDLPFGVAQMLDPHRFWV